MKRIVSFYKPSNSLINKEEEANEYRLGITKRLLEKYKPSKNFISVIEGKRHNQEQKAA